MTSAEIDEAVDQTVARFGKKRGALIILLQKVQERLGYLPRPAIERLAQHLCVSAAEVMGVLTFYAQFRLKPVGRQHIRVCHGTACHVSGADKVSFALKEELGIGHGETTPDGEFSIENVACLGCCSLAPVVMVQDETYGGLGGDKAKRVIKERRERKSRTAAARRPAAAPASGPVKPAPGVVGLRLGLGSCGVAAGARKTWEALRAAISERGLALELSATGCNGMCHAEPLLEVLCDGGRSYLYGGAHPEAAARILEEHVLGGRPVEKLLVLSPERPMASHPYYAQQKRIVLRNCGVIDPDSLEAYERAGGYQALRKALAMKPEAVIAEIFGSGLRGRGGGGFPTGTKWKFARANPDPVKYVICNGDEGDPGAFMD
ncbi:MAG: NADH-quinone oxidoreductase subunit NuoE, partial [Elusimicrobia bacterium]|nr:NADH-quinone oxidoreductase subunit NuoE [Elusimicrobiota bacterium]